MVRGCRVLLPGMVSSDKAIEERYARCESSKTAAQTMENRIEEMPERKRSESS